MKFIYIFLLLSLITIFFFIFKSGIFDVGSSKYKQAIVSIRGERFRVEVADTFASRELGLGGREGLAEDEGMLFLFNSLSVRTFWMKDVSFPIDIIWIAGDKVVGFAQNTTPHTNQFVGQIARYKSPEVVDKVLEVSGGTVKRVGIIVGDGVEVKFED